MKRIFILLPLVLLSACASKKPAVVKMPPVVSGTTLSPADRESVRYGENLKAYQVGRYIDPNTDMVMHEAHTIYRVETTAKWNLHPNVYPYPPGSLPGGPVVGIIDPAHKDSPITPEIAAEVDRQKAMSQALMADHQQMNHALNQLSTVMPATAQIAKENALLKVQAMATQRRLEILEDEFRKQQLEEQAQRQQQQAQQEQQHETEASQPVMPPVNGTNDW
jgi:hypothetical protein